MTCQVLRLHKSWQVLASPGKYRDLSGLGKFVSVAPLVLTSLGNGLSKCAGRREQCSEANKILWGQQGKIYCCFVAKSIMLRFTRNWQLFFFYENIPFYLYFWQVVKHSVRDLASLREAHPTCERPGLPVRGLPSLWEAKLSCKRPGLPFLRPDLLAIGLSSLLEHSLSGWCPASLWEA